MNPVLPERYREEQLFLRNILFDPENVPARLIYADWLDERSDMRAQLLRIDVQIVQTAPEDLNRRQLIRVRSDLLPKLDRAWVCLLASAPIEKCSASLQATLDAEDVQQRSLERVELVYRCPQRWENLQPMDEKQEVRFCSQCNRSVHYCFDIQSARIHAGSGNCVAIDLSVSRAGHDLEISHLPLFGQLLGRLADD